MRTQLLIGTLCAFMSIGAAHAADRAADLRKLYDEVWEERLELSPISATFAGDPRYNAELPNFLSQEYEDQSRAFHQAYLDRAKAIGADGLTGQDRLSYDVFTLNRESEIEQLRYPDRLIPIDQFYNIANQFAQLGSGT